VIYTLKMKYFFLSLGPHGAYSHMRKLKSQAVKVSTVASVMHDK